MRKLQLYFNVTSYVSVCYYLALYTKIYLIVVDKDVQRSTIRCIIVSDFLALSKDGFFPNIVRDASMSDCSVGDEPT